MILPKFREKKKPTLCPRPPLCIWALLHKALHKHVLTWSLTGVLVCFSIIGFVFALQVQVWETALLSVAQWIWCWVFCCVCQTRCLRSIKERLKSPVNLDCCTQEMSIGSELVEKLCHQSLAFYCCHLQDK